MAPYMEMHRAALDVAYNLVRHTDDMRMIIIKEVDRTSIPQIAWILNYCPNANGIELLNVNIRDDELFPLIDVLVSCPRLTKIAIRSSHLRASHVDYLFTGCSRLRNLQELDILNHCCTASEMVQLLNNHQPVLDMLQKLDVGNTDYEDDQALLELLSERQHRIQALAVA